MKRPAHDARWAFTEALFMFTKCLFISFALAVVLSITISDVESRRLVLRGRRTVTRHYYCEYPQANLVS